ncbi:MAG: hypothetical protein ABL897_02645 [Hyphomicrobium sp.]
MFQRIASVLRVVLGLATLTASIAVARADAALDIKSIPRMPGHTEVWNNDETLLYMSPETPEATGKALRATLTADGWTLYDSPPYEQQTEDSFQTQDFKKGPHAISVYVVAAPAKNNRTSVQYGIYPVAEPLPHPKDAIELGFSLRSAHLECISAQSVDQLFDFYKAELASAGWQRWTMPGADTAKKPSGSIRSHFVKENKQPLLLILSSEKEGRTIVYLKGVPHEEMMAEYAPKPKPEAAAAPAPPQPAVAENDDDDTPEVDIEALIKGAIKDAMKPVTKPASKPKNDAVAVTEADPPVVTLGLLSGTAAPIPLPETAEAIDHDEEDGTLEFHSKSNVKSLAEFYRAQMKGLGWKETPGVLNSNRLMGLDFRKGKSDRIGFTIHNMTDRVEVSVRGDVLKVATAAPPPDSMEATADPQSIEQPSEAAKQYALSELEAAETNKLPVPKPNSSVGTLKSKFQYAALASLPASIETVVAFYRRELTKREWTEDTGAADIKADAATLKFTTKEGPAILKLVRRNSEINIELTVRQKALAEASGLMPKAGNVKIMFGNIEDTASEITFNGKKFKVKSGERAEDPKGPSIELPPGKYTFEVKSKGKPAQKDEATFGGDEIWGVLIGPGGGLPLQMY